VTALNLSGLHVRLGSREVLDGIDLTFEPGRLTVIVGPNGAGKTTLLRVLAGLVAPLRGAVTAGNEAVHAMSRARRARTFAYLPQGGVIAWPLAVATVVALGRLPHGEAVDALPAQGRRAVAEAIAAAGLEGFEARPATELSGGERGRALLARALAVEAPILLADEPVAALDPRHQLLVLGVLRARALAGATVVAVMHDLGLAARFAESVVLLDAGRVVASGPPEAVLTQDGLRRVFGIEARVAREDAALVIIPRRALPHDDRLGGRASGAAR
jgi:iron complex transport system ATP-binding protein